MESNRRKRTNSESSERESQINAAKIEASRFLSTSHLKKVDQATYRYLHRHRLINKLNNYLSHKRDETLGTCIRMGMDHRKTDSMILADLEENLAKDKIFSVDQYEYYRPGYYNYMFNGKGFSKYKSHAREKLSDYFDDPSFAIAKISELDSTKRIIYKNYLASKNKLLAKLDKLHYEDAPVSKYLAIDEQIKEIDKVMKAIRNE